MKRNRTRYCLAIIVAACVVANTTAAGLASAATAPTVAPLCADVLFLGARGSGQPQAGNSSDQNTGLGPQVLAAFSDFSAGVGQHRTVARLTLMYPAEAVKTIPEVNSPYFHGISEGVNTADSLLSVRQRSCPNERIVLAGYSQGAMVMHRLIQRFDAQARTNFISRFDGAILIGDGDRVPNDTATLYGTASPNRRGIGQFLTNISHSSPTPFPQYLGALVSEVCNRNDPVCDTTSASLANFLGSINIHTGAGYKAASTIVAGASGTVATTDLSVPLPTPRNISIPLTGGTPVSRPLLADVSPAGGLEWRVLVPAVLPVGLTLDTTGLVHGTPSSTPTAVNSTPIQVRAVTLGVPGVWINAQIQWLPGPTSTGGTVRAWGYNAYGELGNGTTTSSSTPVQVSGLTGVTAIAGSEFAGYALLADGTVRAWGYNGDGRLGNGTTTSSSIPVQVSGLTGVTAVAAADAVGGTASGGDGYALLADGTVRAWGLGTDGELGNHNSSNSSSPVQVSGLTGVTAIAAAGAGDGYALLADGTVRAWGINFYGELGNDTTSSSYGPVQVTGLTGVTNIAGGYGTGYALLGNGTVRAWGGNIYGELGNGATNTFSTALVQVTGLTGVTAIAGGFYAGYALLADGTVRAWGEDAYGQLGNGTTTPTAPYGISTPVQVTGLTGITAVAGGNGTGYALRSGA